VTDNYQPKHRDFYKSLPKVELHRHLEGSLRLSTMIDIVNVYDLDLPKNAEKFKPLVHVIDEDQFTFKNFLSKFSTLRLLYQSPEMIKRITQEAIEDAANDNIRYLELRFTPVALTRIKDFPLSEAMDWVIASVAEASKKFGVKTSLIATVNRHEDLNLAEEVVKLTVDRKDRGISALDLTGNEADFPGEEFAGIFKEAKQAGLRITIHAGEWGGPENIELAIKKLGAERIGHGVRVLEDPNVVDLARERKIIFEVCPTSNYQTGVFPSIEEHSLPKMMENGLIITLNTDDPGISQIDLSNEYGLACEMFGFDLDTLRETIISAARGAFMQDGHKDELITRIDKEFNANKLESP
jgi:adenosine deaminase